MSNPHIDRVIASIKANPEVWLDSRRHSAHYIDSKLWTSAWEAAGDRAIELVGYDGMQTTRNMISDTAEGDLWDAADDIAMAIIAYPESVYLLDSDPEHVKMLAKLGDLKAAMMIVGCYAFAKEKALV